MAHIEPERRQSLKTSRRGLVTLAAACSLILAGCTGGSDEGNEPGGLESRGVFDVIRARSTMASRADGLYASVPEAMPQVRYLVNGSEPVSVADAYVVGSLVLVDSGRTFQWTIDPVTGEETRREVPFNTEVPSAETSQASTVHLTLEIERSIVSPDEPESVRDGLKSGNTVRLGLTLGAQVNLDAVQAELRAVDSFAALLYRPSAVFDYDRDLWAVLEDGAFLGTISGDGTQVVFPALEGDGDRQASFTVEELERPRDEPIRVNDAVDGGRG
jgi:hypothetical protein